MRTAAAAKPTNAELAESVYTALADGDIDTALRVWSPDIEWTVPAGAPYNGTFHGVEEVREKLCTRLEEEWENWTHTPEEIHASNDLVFVLGHYRAVHRSTGKAFTSRFSHIWRFRDSLAVRFESVYDTHAVVAAMY